MKRFFLTCLLVVSFGIWMQAAQGYRAYNRPQGGYIVLDEQNELVAVGDHGSADNISAGLLNYLGVDNIPVSDEMPKQYAAQALIIVDSVGPLLGDITFDQTAPYNRQTPMLGSKHCLTGCVATAMAQILTYYQYPEKCKPGTKTYTSATEKIPVTYTFDNVTFDWSKILHNYITGDDRNYTDEQAEEVAKLMAACGAAVEMDYGLSGSGSMSQWVPDALVTYFDYHLGIDFENKSDFTNDDEFNKALIDEFKAQRPIYAAGKDDNGGHAYVIDGYLTYQGAEAYPLFHYNWGWSGDGNEWVMFKKAAHNQSFTFIRHIQPNNGTGVEAIAKDADLTNAAVYDILGNNVTGSTLVPGHIYIRSGKKFIAR